MESRKAKFGKEKCIHWKSKTRKFLIGNEKYPNQKLVMRKFKISNWIGNGHGPSGPLYHYENLLGFVTYHVHVRGVYYVIFILVIIP